MSAGKKHRKLSKKGKKIIRRAIGAVLMITAIIIAALPSDNVKANTTNVAEKYKIYRRDDESFEKNRNFGVDGLGRDFFVYVALFFL